MHILSEALHAASAQGHLRPVELLLRACSKVNVGDIDGRTALHYAMSYLHDGVAELLVEKGATISIEHKMERELSGSSRTVWTTPRATSVGDPPCLPSPPSQL